LFEGIFLFGGFIDLKFEGFIDLKFEGFIDLKFEGFIIVVGFALKIPV
jgi:hypothetical protein